MTKRVAKQICLLIALLLIALCATSCSFNWFGLVKQVETEQEARENIAGIGKHAQTDEESGDDADAAFEPMLYFVVAGDTHMSADDAVATERLRQMSRAIDAQADAFIRSAT